GYCCNRCHPGFRMTKACAGAGLRTTCEPCSNGTYLELSNAATKCIRCRKCESGESQPGDPGSDRITHCNTTLHPQIFNDLSFLFCMKCDSWSSLVFKTARKDRKQVDEQKENLGWQHAVIFMCNSRKECSHLCPTSTTPREPMKVAPPPEIPNNWWQTIAISLAVAMACAVVVVGGRRIHKRIRRSRASSYYTVLALILLISVFNFSGNTCIQSTTSQNSEHKQPELPDCVPRTINISQFLYSVMEVVPVSRWKELIRRLGVSEREIERAERDNRVYSEAQYYMIQLWSRAGGGGGGLSPSLPLPRPLALSLLQTLREMGLGGCAEQLDQRYNISLE
uniref:Tumor necrosis factor receptor superfamily, member 1a n=1 Tax=Lepisosteus oculatus TaxID=7918 RepID=W5MIV7_LEPOC